MPRRDHFPLPPPLPPERRRDGELYGRPEPNPFTKAWTAGYDAGFNGEYPSISGYTKLDVIRYQDGYDAGLADRGEVDSVNSSNT